MYNFLSLFINLKSLCSLVSKYDIFFKLQSNFNDSNTFGTMKISSRQG